MKKVLCILLICLMAIGLISCSKSSKWEGNNKAPNDEYPNHMTGAMDQDSNYEKNPGNADNAVIKENPFISVSEQKVSTFSADVDTASYTYLRKLIAQGRTLEEIRQFAQGSLRTEEMVNYFDYQYAAPEGNDLFGKTVSIAKTPWNSETYLMVLGLQAKQVEKLQKNNLVFLIDVSGSMASDDKLPLLQRSFSYLTEQLSDDDIVSIVTYSGKEAVVLRGCEGNRTGDILSAIQSLKASGSTNGQSGLQKAYELARENFISDGNNRIIMASDGDLNVGISSPEELKNYISGKRNEGIYLSVLGFGSGNFRDDNMSALAQNGNGVYYYIDGDAEARRIFGDGLLSTLYTVGKDVKLQITFDENYVSEYRLIGYENRMLSEEDFIDDTKDAGEVGSGHTLTVCYELKLKNDTAFAEESSPWMTLAIRHKNPDSEISILKEYKIGKEAYTETPDEDFQFVSTVIEFSMILRNSKYRNPQRTMTILAEELEAHNPTGNRAEFLAMIQKLK